MFCSLNSESLLLTWTGRLRQRKPCADPATVLCLGVILFRMVNGIQTIITDFEDLKFAVNVSKGERTALPITHRQQHRLMHTQNLSTIKILGKIKLND